MFGLLTDDGLCFLSMRGNFPSQSNEKEFFFVFFNMECDEAIGTFSGVLVVVIGDEIFCIVKLASGTRDLLFARLIKLISHSDSIVSLQWVVVDVAFRWSFVGLSLEC